MKILAAESAYGSSTHRARDRGALLFQVVRNPGKRFLPRKPDGDGGWEWKLGGTNRVLYRLPELIAAEASAIVYITEGEKDADTLAQRGSSRPATPAARDRGSSLSMPLACSPGAMSS